MFSKMPHLAQRLIMGTFGLSLALFAIYLSHDPKTVPIIFCLVTLITCIAQREYYKIAAIKGYQPQTTIGLTSTTLYIGAAFLAAHFANAELLPISTLGLTFLTVFTFYIFWGSNPFVNVAITLFGIIYLTIPLSSMVHINYFFPADSVQDGRWWIVYLIVITFITDSSAYFFGKTLGKNKLAPYISPKKTWEGALGGYTIAVATSMLFSICASSPQSPIPISLSLGESFVLGSALAILAQIGDLAESLLKRDAGVKDSSHIPGLGGMLDVVDSLVFTSPALLFFLKMQ